MGDAIIRADGMRTGTVVQCFGPFELDPASGRLFQGQTRVRLSDPQAAILLRLVAHAGQVVSKEALVEAGWGTVAVGGNSLDQSMSRLRKRLGQTTGGACYIETVPNQGYRFAASVERSVRVCADAARDDTLAPFRAFIHGRSDLDRLTCDAIHRARQAFAHVLHDEPDYAPAHVGLGFACAVAFDASYVDAACDRDALTLAVQHARQGAALDRTSAEAWSVLAFALHLNGEREHAAAAAWKAVALEPTEWRHRLRLAYVSWGGDRMSAARTALTLCPGLALAHWLTATVLIARGAFDAALDVLREGCAAQAAQARAPGKVPALGLHLLRGLVCAAQDRLDDAARACEMELSEADPGQVYARQCTANAWYALGAARLRQRRRQEAESAFEQALTTAPGHLCTAAAMGRPLPVVSPNDPRGADAATAHAIRLARAGRHPDAALAFVDALAALPSPAAGWILPVEPLLHTAARPSIWADALAIVRQRAV
jgi:DNA-binding winged helix-turn-helix (wHTH) protein/Flp pilus assembly protein TadD